MKRPFLSHLPLWILVVALLAGCHSTKVPIELPEPPQTANKPMIEELEPDVPSSEKIETSMEQIEVPSTQPAIHLDENSTFEIVFLDVGQADAALVSCDNHHMLIDGGNKGDSDLLYTVLRNKEISHLDFVVGTHAHEDHIGGIPGSLSYATADVVFSPVTEYDSDAFHDFKTYSRVLTVPQIGDHYTLGSATVDILGLNACDDTNNTSIMLKITYGDTSFLFTGDAEYEAEQAVLNSDADLSATVLKVGHHGSDTSTSYQFLRAVMPQYGVISCGTDNSYGHPTDAVLSRLRDADVTVYRTDLQGDIVCTSNGKTVTMTSNKTATKDSLLSPGVTIKPPQVDTPAPAGTCRYILNTNTKKIHQPTCGSAAKIANKNYGESNATREELIAQGYDPCGNCDP